MWKLLLLLSISLSQVALSQDLGRDVDFIETQNTKSNPFNLPINVDVEGNLSIIYPTGAAVNFRPNMQLNYRKEMARYIRPIQTSNFSLLPQDKRLGWIQVKRKRWEVGLGLGAVMKTLPLYAGLTPYKGARQVMTRYLDRKDQRTPAPRFPRDLSEISRWSVGDQGTFQTYGGIQFLAGVKYSAANILSLGFTIQNLFNVSIKRNSEDEIHLSISEEDLKKRKVESGVGVSAGAFSYFKGKRLTTRFKLNLDNPAHHILFKKAIKGDLVDLQKELPPEKQLMQWNGTEWMGYLGIPGVAGRYYARSDFDMEFEGEEETLDIKSKRNAGFLIPLRNHNKLVYQTEDSLVLFWYSEMLKTKGEVFTEKFLAPGFALGAPGFQTTLSNEVEMGATLSQMGLSFAKKELLSITPEVLEEILQNFEQRCHELKLSCADKNKHLRISKKLRRLFRKSWEDARDNLGFLLLKEPALIHSIIKGLKAQKVIYFKFLSENYQSMEGSALIEI